MPGRLLKEILLISFRQRLDPAVTCFVRNHTEAVKEQFIDLSLIHSILRDHQAFTGNAGLAFRTTGHRFLPRERALHGCHLR